MCPWPVLSLSNLNGISDEYKIQIQVSQDKQYFDCILNKKIGTNSHTQNTKYPNLSADSLLAESLLNTNMSIDCLSVCKIIDMIYITNKYK